MSSGLLAGPQGPYHPSDSPLQVAEVIEMLLRASRGLAPSPPPVAHLVEFGDQGLPRYPEDVEDLIERTGELVDQVVKVGVYG